ncbi:MAG: metal ABC transporter ATP-binding protein [Candidatus Glassbacteria bacterium]
MIENSLEVKNLTVSYGGKTVLRNVTFSLPRGVSVSIVGPNGAGKSTLLQACLGLIERDTGEVRVLGEPFEPRRGILAYIPQKEQIDWDFPVRVQDVVLMGRSAGLGWFGRPGRDDRRVALEALRQTGMAEYAGRHIRQLSGGQQQRVFIARALAQGAAVLIMDEPFAGVDAATENTILELMDRFTSEGKTVVMVNHDLGILHRFDWIVMLNGTLIAAGPTAETFGEHNRQLTFGPTLNEIASAEQIIEKGVAR